MKHNLNKKGAHGQSEGNSNQGTAIQPVLHGVILPLTTQAGSRLGVFLDSSLSLYAQDLVVDKTAFV